MWAGGSLAALLLALGVLGGCGGGEVRSGATVRAYFGSSLCPAARRALARDGDRAGGVRVAAVCLAPVAGVGEAGLSLAAVGSNARRAAEDSAAVALVEAPGAGNRFSRPVLEQADIAFLASTSGVAAVERILAALRGAGSASPRTAVHDAL